MKASVFLVLGLLVGAVAGYGAGYFTLQPTINGLTGRVAQLDSRVADAESTSSRLQAELAETRNTLASRESSLRATQATLSSTEQTLVNTRSELSSALQEAGVLNANLTEARNSLTRERERVEELGSETTSLRRAIELNDGLSLTVSRASNLYFEAARKIGVDNTAAIALLRSASSELDSALQTAGGLSTLYGQLGLTPSARLLEAYSKAVLALQHLINGTIPLLVFLDDFGSAGGSATPEQKNRWLSLLDEAEAQFELALTRFKEAGDIQPEISSKALLGELETLIDATASLRDTVSRVPTMEELARREQPPLIYGTIDAADFATIMWPRFREAYPWAPANGRYIEGFAALRARFISEYQAGVATADILWQSQVPMVVELSGFLRPLPDMAHRDLYPEELYSADGRLYTTVLLTSVIAYNPNRMTAGEAPQGWLTLGDPRFKAKIVMQDVRRLESSAKILADIALEVGDTRFDQFLRALASNNPTFTSSNAEAYVKIAAGEFPVGIVLINDVLTQTPGTPVNIAWPQEEPLAAPVAASQMIGINNHATNPNFARLFVEWVLSPEGMRAIAETGRPPALLTLEHPLSLGSLMPANIRLLPTNLDFFTNGQAWADRYAIHFPST